MTHKAPPAAIRPLLQRIGLDERETEVYLALLPMKVARARAISRASKQSRSHTYLVLRSLIEKGLVSEIERGKILHFVAEPPQRLLSYIGDKEQELHDLKPIVESTLPLLSSLSAPLVGKPRVTLLTGLEGMKQIYRDVLREDFFALFNAEVMYATLGYNVPIKLFGKHVALRGRDLLVDNAGAMRYLKEVEQRKDYKIRLLPQEVRFGTDTIVLRDTIALFAYDADLTIARIENQNLADAFRAWHGALWNISRKTA
jgi:predicted DNA-binding transcriptional regulator